MQLIKLLPTIKRGGNKLLQTRNFPYDNSLSSYPSLHLEHLRVLWLIPSSPQVIFLIGLVARGFPTPILQLFNFIIDPQAPTIDILSSNIVVHRVCLVAIKCFSENTYFPEMLISGKGKCFPLFGCLGNRFLENQFQCLVRPNILWKSFYGKSIPVFDSSKHFTENTLRKSFYGKSFPVFGLWIILQKIWNVLQIQAPVLSRQTCNSTKLIIHFNIKNNHSNWGIWIA